MLELIELGHDRAARAAGRPRRAGRSAARLLRRRAQWRAATRRAGAREWPKAASACTRMVSTIPSSTNARSPPPAILLAAGGRAALNRPCAASPASSTPAGSARSTARCCTRMNESQHHRGPDEGGLHVEPGVGLGHRRLSIIDVATGQQPLFNEDGSRRRRLQRRDLQLPGADPRAAGARPRLPHARATPRSSCMPGRQWGEACVERFRGMFAFALWDRNRADAVPGARPARRQAAVLRAAADGTLLFGSELKSLLAHPGLRREHRSAARSRSTSRSATCAEPRTIFTAGAQAAARRTR